MSLDLGAVILGALDALDRLLDHGFAVLVACLVVCLTAIVWKFSLGWYVEAVLAAMGVLVLAGAGGFVVWLVGRRFLPKDQQ